MQFYHAGGGDSVRPQFEVRNNKVYATIYNKEAAGKTSVPWYEIRGNNIHTTAYNPKGHDIRPMYEIRGNEVHATLHNPERASGAVFNIKKF